MRSNAPAKEKGKEKEIREMEEREKAKEIGVRAGKEIGAREEKDGSPKDGEKETKVSRE